MTKTRQGGLFFYFSKIIGHEKSLLQQHLSTFSLIDVQYLISFICLLSQCLFLKQETGNEQVVMYQ